MPSDAAKKRKAAKAAKKAGKGNSAAAAAKEVDEQVQDSRPAGAQVLDTTGISAAGVLASHPLSRDMKIERFTLAFHGFHLLNETDMEFNYGRRYGLVGLNGCGKSTLLRALAAREGIPIPDHFDIYYLHKEVDATDDTALKIVSSVDEERAKLEHEIEKIIEKDSDGDAMADMLEDLYERMDELGIDTAETRAGNILHGLGFTAEMQQKKAKDFSGGWRMRIALARALFLSPSVLLLDEPTNHLDLEACVWLEEYLKTFKHILVLVSHSQDFLNGVCTNIIHMQRQTLMYYGGNYDTYIQTRKEKEENQMKQYQWEQDQIAHMKDYIARFGHGSAKLAKQAQSKEKTLAKMVRDGLTEKVVVDKITNLKFNSCGTLPPPVLQFVQVTFGYSEDKILYRDLDLGVDLDSRIALVGPNGAGKSTLLKLMVNELEPLNGMVKRHPHLRIARYHQHSADQLDVNMSPLDYMCKEFPEYEVQQMRSVIGQFGITGGAQTAPIKNLSDGQKSRVVFSWISTRKPHMLLLDEPTNHLDIETIDALASAINSFEGGMVLVSHDFRLISQVAKEIWEAADGTVKQIKGDIISYKRKLRKKAGLEK